MKEGLFFVSKQEGGSLELRKVGVWLQKSRVFGLKKSRVFGVNIKDVWSLVSKNDRIWSQRGGLWFRRTEVVGL